jgi:hypothetical protein
MHVLHIELGAPELVWLSVGSKQDDRDGRQVTHRHFATV